MFFSLCTKKIKKAFLKLFFLDEETNRGRFNYAYQNLSK